MALGVATLGPWALESGEYAQVTLLLERRVQCFLNCQRWQPAQSLHLGGAGRKMRDKRLCLAPSLVSLKGDGGARPINFLLL